MTRVTPGCGFIPELAYAGSPKSTYSINSSGSRSGGGVSPSQRIDVVVVLQTSSAAAKAPAKIDSVADQKERLSMTSVGALTKQRSEGMPQMPANLITLVHLSMFSTMNLCSA
jgi:hypothetical protein